MLKTKDVKVQFKAGPEDGLEEGEFIVYPSTFTRDPDAYGDVVAKGAFADTIREWEESGNVLPGLFGHRMDDPDFYVAEAVEMSEDDHGWRIKGRFDLDSPKGPQVYRLVKGKRLNQLSFAYETLEEGAVELENGETANELRKLRVHEFSFVPVGANQSTSVFAVKSAVEVLAKAGRSLSAKNEQALRDARDSIDSVLASLGDDEPKATEPGGSKHDQEEASGTPEVKPGASDEDPVVGKSSAPSEEPKVRPSVDRLAAKFNIYAAAYAGQEGV